ncbi:DUF4083 domain-containing protein [Bacillus cereus]|uniref:DUF4083 domain-containing protein n=1 Tax=Bacillus cereus TaxID=1396 RepID=UPI000BF55E3C|nr:DUF4083 domain-containing protein [Bacillus cereus]PFA24529.1 DUF4083 domain-containing protein [Bacillus cereus]PGZ18293.1 DUF4083 domain-containing protein [Bacillus cereus]
MSLFENDIFAIAYLFVIVGLIVIFCISFTLFVKRLVLRASVNKNRSKNIEKKLDRIIELLEREKK